MKRKLLSIALVAVLITMALTACGSNKLDGTYRSTGTIAQTFTFDDDQVTMSAFGINATGTYEIENDKLKITYTLFGQQHTWEPSFSQDGDTITINGTAFVKQ